jgi:hypothetical protein
MADYNADFAVTLPSNSLNPAQAYLANRQFNQQQAQFNKEEQDKQQERQYRQQLHDEENDRYKANFIREMLDPNKFQTPVQAINDDFNNQIGELVHKYTSQKSMNYTDLLGNITKDISDLSQKHSSIVNNAERESALIKEYAKQHPEVDPAKLELGLRAGLLDNYVQTDANGNPILTNTGRVTWKPAPLTRDLNFVQSLNDPEVSAKYVDPNKAQSSIIAEMQKKAEGDPTEFQMDKNGRTVKGKFNLKPFQKLNFNPQTDIQYGTLRKGINPALMVDVEDVKGYPYAGDDAYKYFSTKYPTQLAALALNTIPGYAQMKPDAKVLAQKMALGPVLAKFGNDNISFPVESAPPRVSVNVGDKANKEVSINDVYNEINHAVSLPHRVNEGKGAPLNQLSSTAQQLVLKIARDITGKTNDELNYSNIYLKKNKDGQITINDFSKEGNDDVIAPINFTDVNTAANKSTKQRQKVLKEAQQTTPVKNKGKKNDDGLIPVPFK